MKVYVIIYGWGALDGIDRVFSSKALAIEYCMKKELENPHGGYDWTEYTLDEE